MATMTVLSSNCRWADCEARATRRVLTQSGAADGDYCARHGNVRLVELAKEEGQGLHERATAAAPKAVRS